MVKAKRKSTTRGQSSILASFAKARARSQSPNTKNNLPKVLKKEKLTPKNSIHSNKTLAKEEDSMNKENAKPENSEEATTTSSAVQIEKKGNGLSKKKTHQEKLQQQTTEEVPAVPPKDSSTVVDEREIKEEEMESTKKEEEVSEGTKAKEQDDDAESGDDDSGDSGDDSSDSDDSDDEEETNGFDFTADQMALIASKMQASQARFAEIVKAQEEQKVQHILSLIEGTTLENDKEWILKGLSICNNDEMELEHRLKSIPEFQNGLKEMIQEDKRALERRSKSRNNNSSSRAYVPRPTREREKISVEIAADSFIDEKKSRNAKTSRNAGGKKNSKKNKKGKYSKSYYQKGGKRLELDKALQLLMGDLKMAQSASLTESSSSSSKTQQKEENGLQEQQSMEQHEGDTVTGSKKSPTSPTTTLASSSVTKNNDVGSPVNTTNGSGTGSGTNSLSPSSISQSGDSLLSQSQQSLYFDEIVEVGEVIEVKYDRTWYKAKITKLSDVPTNNPKLTGTRRSPRTRSSIAKKKKKQIARVEFEEDMSVDELEIPGYDIRKFDAIQSQKEKERALKEEAERRIALEKKAKEEEKKKEENSSSNSSPTGRRRSLRARKPAAKLLNMGWSEARTKAWLNRERNENAYYYRFNEPGEVQRTGGWSKEEHDGFIDLIKNGVDYRWGILSKNVPGRVGYQCSNYYRKLVEKGKITDPNYSKNEKGKLVFAFKNRSKSKSGNGIGINSKTPPEETRKKKKKTAEKKTKRARKTTATKKSKSAASKKKGGAKKKRRRKKRRNEWDSDDEADDLYIIQAAKRSRSSNEPELLLGFKDPMTRMRCDDPAISPFGHVMSYQSWMRVLIPRQDETGSSHHEKNTCPFTKQKLSHRSLVKLDKENLKDYIGKICNWDVAQEIKDKSLAATFTA
eukprot:g4079.t1